MPNRCSFKISSADWLLYEFQVLLLSYPESPTPFGAHKCDTTNRLKFQCPHRNLAATERYSPLTPVFPIPTKYDPPSGYLHPSLWSVLTALALPLFFPLFLPLTHIDSNCAGTPSSALCSAD